jgi:DNA-binding transcriptional ArsR family regulator
LNAKDGVTNHDLVQATKLEGGTVSAALRQLRDEGKVKSSGQGRGTTWKLTGK